MTLATLDSIKDAILAQARTLHADVGGPFLTVDNFAGNLTQSAAQEMINTIFAMAPGVLIACAGETYEVGGRNGAPVTLAAGSTGCVGTSIWHAYVISLNVETTRTVSEPGITKLGVYDLASQAIDILNGLEIDGLYRADTLDVVDSKPYWWKADQYVWLARFSARRWLKNVRSNDDSAPFQGIDANVNVPDTGESVTTPIVTLEADFTE